MLHSSVQHGRWGMRDGHRTARTTATIAGFFFAWHDMSFARGGETLRGDFWGWGQFAPIENRVIVNRDVRLARTDAPSAEVAVRQRLDHREAGGHAGGHDDCRERPGWRAACSI